MASSAKKALKLRLMTAIQSERLRRSGLPGACPTRERRSVAVDKAEAAESGLLLALSTPSEDQACRRTHTARQEEPGPQRAGGHDRQLRAHLARDVRRLAEALAERLGGRRELLALRLEVAADVVRRACAVIRGCHRSSAPPM